MECPHFSAARCLSCTLMGVPYAEQVAAKEQAVRALLPAGIDWLPSVVGPESGFRNKAKMVVTGTVAAPVLGILDRSGGGIDLQDCGLYPPELSDAFAPLSRFITLARLTPYDVAQRRGELKYLLITVAPDGGLMVRFVVRSTESLSRIRKHLPTLLGWLPQARVVSVNLQPEHKAVLEGEREELLLGESLTMRVNDLDLHLRPQSFFQTNTEVAAALYRQVQEWVAEGVPREVWDLYCGVGGFALHCAAAGRRLVGVEVSAEAVASAQRSATALPGDVEFIVADATRWAVARTDAPDLVVVNPPRRGIGPDLADWLERSTTPTVVYSSCNASTLARDLAAMPSLQPVRARVLDMFPQTDHYEVAVLLERTVRS
ncbi:23S rRNA (uracil(747)-C(5))-methyltransferase RlmC [Nocardioides alcanivorans]|uniref:23S rRNA (uracil(747)-C(5))-methyltransferase RlmC n=1 Tax=Nocardioides alcanivorans TaxID=2897352 RepID=UPI001F2071CC|nr:23S rRNA (uracil(747)-C(5))-methyltransferase RlmC [Nocardioides alcanivorans]